MSWNNGYERKRFEAKQKKLAEEYRKAGMTEEQIKAMYEFDLEQFKKDRIYQMHTQALQVEEFDELDADESDNALIKHFENELTTSIEDGEHSRYWWIEELDNAELAKKIKSLTKEQIELLTFVVVDGYDQTEIAKILNVNQSTISRRFEAIKKFLRNFEKNA